MRVPRAIQHLVDAFERLPGIGPKTAQRLTFYLLHVPQGELDRFAQSVQNLRKDIVMCSICYGVDEHDPCDICMDAKRDKSVVCVVEQPLDVLAIDKTGKFNGTYHVLHGKIDPLSNIGPDEIRIGELLNRIKNPAFANGFGGQAEIREIILATNPTMEGEATPQNASLASRSSSSPARSASTGQAAIREVILATNPTMEGEATAMYLAKQIKGLNLSVKVTRIGRGLPTGADLEYADSMTLERALEGRSDY